MEPKIGWCQKELLICKAYQTWNSIIINSDLFSTSVHRPDDYDLLNLSNHDNNNNNNNTDLTKRKQTSNKASIYSINLPETTFLNDSMSTPWIPSTFKYDSGYTGLHDEILLFNKYISPTVEELYMRDETISKIMNIITKELNQNNIHINVFGSYKTGLFLPTSDIDMVIFGDWKHLPLNQLKLAIIRDQICDHDNVLVLDKASVPIIKIIDSKTELKIDISFNTINGVNSAKMIQDCLTQFPALRPLVMVLKHFLLQWDYNEVWRGGISSYSLILMTINFLQMHPRIDPRTASENLGILLIEFFELYGKKFNYFKTAIRIRDGGSYIAKDDIRKQFTNGHASILCIEDPLNEMNDIGKSSYGALKVQQAFEYAFLTLGHLVLPQNIHLIKECPSILGRILRVTKDILDYRMKIKMLYQDRFYLNSVEHNNCQKLQQQKVEFFIGENNNNLFNNNINYINDVNNNVNKNLIALSSKSFNFLLIDYFCLPCKKTPLFFCDDQLMAVGVVNEKILFFRV
jgi:non-canonical poly(A) RNA polymerase PAPD5/7